MAPAAAPAWFIALPDHQDGEPFARRPELPGGTQLICHASSGRPWLVGHWPAAMQVVAGRTRVVVIGRCLVEAGRLRAHAQQAAATGDFDRLTRFAGSYYLLVATDDAIRLYGDAAGLRLLCHTTVGSVPLVSNRSDLLARLTRASVSDRWLARALAFSTQPPPLADETAWTDVRVVPPGQRVTIDREMRVRTHAHWQPPLGVRSLRDGASALASALADAVAGRLRYVSRASCDLSGGKDSTTLTFLAHQAATESSSALLAVTMPGIAPDNDDQRWAGRAATYLTNAHHLVVRARDCPLPYHDLDRERPWTEEPSVFSMHSARYRHLASQLRGHGTELHLTGHGGDDVLEAPLAYVRDSLRRRPWRAIRHARGHAALTGTAFVSYLEGMVSPGGYAAWLRHLADQVRRRQRGTARSGTSAMGWTDASIVPPWITQEATATIRDDLQRAARDAARPPTTRGQFAALCAAGAVGRMLRLHHQFMDQLGVRVESPFLDRAVVEACLAVRGDERTDPWRYKPLLDAAMAGVVPQPLLARDSKGHYTEDTMTGLRRQTRTLNEIFTDSALGERGLIDTNRLRDSLLGGAWERLPLGPITATLACELWARDAATYLHSDLQPNGMVPWFSHCGTASRPPRSRTDWCSSTRGPGTTGC